MSINFVVQAQISTNHENMCWFNSLTTEKQTTKFSSANFQKNFKSKLCHIENSKTREQTV